MATVVVPFRSTDPKHRLAALADQDRERLARAMLGDVVAAAGAVGQVIVVTTGRWRLARDITFVPDPHRGQGAAVRAGLDYAVSEGMPAPYLVVNADLPCATARDLLALAGAVPEHGLAYVPAADGTTNALGLSDASLFEPVYGPGSAARFAALAPSTRLDAPNLIADVDTIGDLAGLAERVGNQTLRMVVHLRLEPAA